MNIIRSDETDKAVPSGIDSDSLDLWTTHSLNTWAASRKVARQDQLRIICMMVLVPG
jgi:hypothetical protein